MRTVYACTHVSKRVEKDFFETGCDPGSGHFTMDEHSDVTGLDMAELLSKLGDRYGLDIDDVWIADEQPELEGVSRIGYNRLECDDGTPPDRHEEYEWRHDQRRYLWLADYDFMVEKRTVEHVPIGEIMGVVKTHS